ncbi:MAG: hypothetical protein IJP07_04630 [Firmicutes bacterium]|nr:hypothetical protein [Bacillota bacterium]
MDQHTENTMPPVQARRVEEASPQQAESLLCREDVLLRSKFPHIFAFCRPQGHYLIPDAEQLLSGIEGGMMLQTSLSAAVLRVDMCISQLWLMLEHLFNFHVFPSRLASAQELLEAARFADDEPAEQAGELQALCRELQQALEALESSLAAEAVSAASVAEAEKE